MPSNKTNEIQNLIFLNKDRFFLYIFYNTPPFQRSLEYNDCILYWELRALPKEKCHVSDTKLHLTETLQFWRPGEFGLEYHSIAITPISKPMRLIVPVSSM